jgi:hypothetical protein
LTAARDVAYFFTDDWGDEKRGETVGADDKAVHRRRVAFLFGKTWVEGRKEADGERRCEGGGQQNLESIQSQLKRKRLHRIQKGSIRNELEGGRG